MNSVERVYAYATLPAGNVVEFNYPNFSSTTGLVQVSTAGVIGNLLYLTPANVQSDIGNVYRSTTIQYNRNFSFEWNFECSNGSANPADGFCLQWTTTNNTNGGSGSVVGYVSTATQAFLFQTFTNKQFLWYKNNVIQSGFTLTNQDFYRNLFFWIDYTHSSSTLKIYWDTTNIKPVSPTQTLTGFSFDSTAYYIGFGAATGGETEAHILKSMKLTFT